MPEKYRLTDRGLVVSGKLSYDEWKGIGQRIERHASGIQWALGDWLLSVPRKETWEETLEEAEKVVGYAWETLRTHRTVAEAFRHSQRAIGLSWSFYRLTIPLEEDQRIPALEEALRRRITYTEFIQWVALRMKNLPKVRMKNPTDSSAARPGRPRRTAGEVSCPHCGHRFHVKIDRHDEAA